MNNIQDIVGVVVDQVEATGKTINPNKKAAIGAYAKRLRDNTGATDLQLEAWAEHYGKRVSAGSRITPSQAWEDVSEREAERKGTDPRKRAADRRVNQALEMGLIKDDPRTAPAQIVNLDIMLATLRASYEEEDA